VVSPGTFFPFPLRRSIFARSKISLVNIQDGAATTFPFFASLSLSVSLFFPLVVIRAARSAGDPRREKVRGANEATAAGIFRRAGGESAGAPIGAALAKSRRGVSARDRA